MKQTSQIQLLPGNTNATRHQATVQRFNEAADWLAGEAFAIKVGNRIQPQKTHDVRLRERFGLSAQADVNAAL